MNSALFIFFFFFFFVVAISVSLLVWFSLSSWYNLFFLEIQRMHPGNSFQFEIATQYQYTIFIILFRFTFTFWVLMSYMEFIVSSCKWPSGNFKLCIQLSINVLIWLFDNWRLRLFCFHILSFEIVSQNFKPTLEQHGSGILKSISYFIMH